MSDFFKPEIKEERVFELVPEGKHAAIPAFFVDCGHHHDTDMKGKKIIKHLVFIGFQLPSVTDATTGKPHWKGDFYTVTDFLKRPGFMFYETSKFNKMLQKWTGEDSDKVKWLDFYKDLVAKGTPAYITIEHSKSKDGTKTYSNILSISPYDGKAKVTLEGDFVSWGFGEDGFDELPGNIKKKIRDSIEMQPKNNLPGSGLQSGDMHNEEDQIPF